MSFIRIIPSFGMEGLVFGTDLIKRRVTRREHHYERLTYAARRPSLRGFQRDDLFPPARALSLLENKPFHQFFYPFLIVLPSESDPTQHNGAPTDTRVLAQGEPRRR